MPERGNTILAGLIDRGHECHCVSMAVGMHCYPTVFSPRMGAASSEQRQWGTDGCQAVMLPQQEI